MSTLHLWGRIFKRFPVLRGLAYADDGNIIGRLSQALTLVLELKSGFKLDGNLDFNLDKTMFLTKDTTSRHVYNRVQFFVHGIGRSVCVCIDALGMTKKTWTR